MCWFDHLILLYCFYTCTSLYHRVTNSDSEQNIFLKNCQELLFFVTNLTQNNMTLKVHTCTGGDITHVQVEIMKDN